MIAINKYKSDQPDQYEIKRNDRPLDNLSTGSRAFRLFPAAIFENYKAFQFGDNFSAIT